MRECSGKRCVDCYGLGPWQTSEWCLVSSQKVGIVEAFAFWKEKAMPLAHAHFTPLYWPLAIPHMEVFSQITVFSSHTWRAPGEGPLPCDSGLSIGRGFREDRNLLNRLQMTVSLQPTQRAPRCFSSRAFNFDVCSCLLI